jgi:putative phosphoribosyl transferase
LAPAIYVDRRDAAKALADSLRLQLGGRLSSTERPLVLAIPRGGVVLGRDVAKVLGADLDIVVPRKIGSQRNPEFAIGATTHDGTLYLDEDAVRVTGASADYIASEKLRQVKEARRRLDAYRGGRREERISGRDVIVVDDGVATGATMKAAIRWVKSRGARLVVAATPVGPSSTLSSLSLEADHVVCPHSPEPFYAIGEFYERFEQVTDEEVKAMLDEFWRGTLSLSKAE